MEPVGAPTARAIAPMVAPEGPWVAMIRPAAFTIWSSSNFEARGMDSRIHVLIYLSRSTPREGDARTGMFHSERRLCRRHLFWGEVSEGGKTPLPNDLQREGEEGVDAAAVADHDAL